MIRKIKKIIMKKVFYTALVVLLTTLFDTAMAADNPSLMKSSPKKVVFTYSEKNVKIDGKEIVLGYYDEVTLTYVVLKEKTNSSGKVSFSVPSCEDGSSYIFTFAFAEENLKKSMSIRIPSDSLYGGQDSISLSLEKGKKWYVLKNSGAPMQWMAYPNERSKINNIKSNINILKYNWATSEASDVKQMGFVGGNFKPIGVRDIFLEGSIIDICMVSPGCL